MNNNTDKNITKATTVMYRPNQQGVALVVVLLFLILIMLAGVMAVRQSNTDLKTATADQINTILLQSSDSVNQKIESIVNSGTDPQALDDITSPNTGMFGYFDNPNNTNNEYVFCFNPRTNAYKINNATVYNSGGGTENNNGICNYNDPNHYTSERQTVMTQVSVRTVPKTGTEPAFEDQALGLDSENKSGKLNKFSVRSTSTIPAYSEPTGCLGKQSTDPANSPAAMATLDCLHQKNTPSKMLYTQENFEKKFTTIECDTMGKGTGVLNPKCN